MAPKRTAEVEQPEVKRVKQEHESSLLFIDIHLGPYEKLCLHKERLRELEFFSTYDTVGWPERLELRASEEVSSWRVVAVSNRRGLQILWC